MPDSYRDRYEARTEIARRRHELDITQIDLAWRAGTSETTLQRLEAGDEANPRIVTLLALAQVLGCELGDLVQDKWREAATRKRRDLNAEAAQQDLLKRRQRPAVE